MNIQDIADDIRDQWNDERFTPWYQKVLIYIALGQCLLFVILELTK
jgi:hypothetical protein